MTNLDSMLKSKDITLLTKVHLVKAMVFPVVLYGYENWTIKKAEHQRIDAFELWCWRRLLRVPWITRRSNQSILKEISPEYSLEELILNLKLQYFDHLMRRTDSFEKTLMLGKIEGGRRRGWQRMRWWIAWLPQWKWVWVNSRNWSWTGKPGVLQSMGQQRVGHDWGTELNWSSPSLCHNLVCRALHHLSLPKNIALVLTLMEWCWLDRGNKKQQMLWLVGKVLSYHWVRNKHD